MTLSIYSDDYFMKQALKEAQKAYEQKEVPVGAVVVCNNKIIARAHNSTELLTDVTAHAEILAITAASNYLGSKYLNDCTLYVTVEPCVMCAGAIQWAQVGKVVFATPDEKSGFLRFGKELLHPKTKLEMGVLAGEAKNMMQRFFIERRKK